MKCFAKTDLGKARELNEDSYYIPSDENEWVDTMVEKLQVS